MSTEVPATPQNPPTPRRILLADADAFFVAVARMIDPEGAGRAPLLIVGGSAEQRGVVCSASYEARRFGVRSAMPMSRAMRLCPDALVVPVPGRACALKSREIRAVLERWAPAVEGASIDEWYLDLGGTERLYRGAPLAETARLIRADVIRETGLSVSLGGGTSKLVAKLAVERAKPKPGAGADGVFVVPAGEEETFMRLHALADIPGVGPKTAERLAGAGLRSVSDLLALDHTALVRLLGEREAAWLAARARGEDEGEVRERAQSKSISRDETFSRDLDTTDALERELLRLCGRIAVDLRAEGLRARTVTVRIRDADFTNRSAGKTVDSAFESDRAVWEIARTLLQKLRRDRRVPARLLSVALTNLAAPVAEQRELFAERGAGSVETERDRVLARTLDAVRARFGAGAIGPARLQDD